MFVDEVEDQLFIYESSDVTVHSFAEVMNCLETVNVSTSRRAMDRVIAVIKALLPKGLDDSRIPSPSQLRLVLLKNIPMLQRIHACSQDCVLFRGPFAK